MIMTSRMPADDVVVADGVLLWRRRRDQRKPDGAG